MKLRLSILTMLIAGSLLSAPSTRGGQIPLKNAPLERETDENLNMKRYVASGDRAYIVGVQNGSLVQDVSLNHNQIGWHITGTAAFEHIRLSFSIRYDFCSMTTFFLPLQSSSVAPATSGWSYPPRMASRSVRQSSLPTDCQSC